MIVDIRTTSYNKNGEAVFQPKIINQETGEVIEGVFALDIRARTDELLSANISIYPKDLTLQKVDSTFFTTINNQKYRLVEEAEK